jgi:hypothetical protein
VGSREKSWQDMDERVEIVDGEKRKRIKGGELGF